MKICLIAVLCFALGFLGHMLLQKYNLDDLSNPVQKEEESQVNNLPDRVNEDGTRLIYWYDAYRRVESIPNPKTTEEVKTPDPNDHVDYFYDSSRPIKSIPEPQSDISLFDQINKESENENINILKYDDSNRTSDSKKDNQHTTVTYDQEGRIIKIESPINKNED